MKYRVTLLLAAAMLPAALLLTACTASDSDAETDTGTNTVATDTDTETESESETETETEPETQTETETVTETETESVTESDTETETETEPETVAATVGTDKQVYVVDEAILVTATGNPDDTLAFFPADFDITVQKPIYYATFGEDSPLTAGTAVDLTTLPGQNRNAAEVAFYYGVLPIGAYKLAVISPTGEVRAESTLTIEYDTDGKITTAAELAAKCIDVAINYDTVYVLGCFGDPMTDARKEYNIDRYAYNQRKYRYDAIMAASEDAFGFDCVNLIKGLFWGWSGDRSNPRGGAVYQSNGVSDINDSMMFNATTEQSTDFTQIEVGEAVWLEGHIGVYIGNGLVVECSRIWDDGVQITACHTTREGYKSRSENGDFHANYDSTTGLQTGTQQAALWVKHGKLPYVTYTGENESVELS